MDRERRGHAGAVQPRRLLGEQVVGAEDLGELLERAVVDAAVASVLMRLPLLPPTSMPSDSASSSWMSTTSIRCASPASESGRSDHGQALTSVSTSSAAACSSRRSEIFAVTSGFSTGSPAPPPEQ